MLLLKLLQDINLATKLLNYSFPSSPLLPLSTFLLFFLLLFPLFRLPFPPHPSSPPPHHTPPHPSLPPPPRPPPSSLPRLLLLLPLLPLPHLLLLFFLHPPLTPPPPLPTSLSRSSYLHLKALRQWTPRPHRNAWQYLSGPHPAASSPYT